jgi:formate--tetrahydrofolate ligase
LQELCAADGVATEVSQVWEQGGAGGEALARKLVAMVENTRADFHPLYDTELPIKSKIGTIVRKIYGGADVTYSGAAEKAIKKIEELGQDGLPVCIAKTPFSLSDRADLRGRPEGFTVNIREVSLSAGAGFIVAIAGEIMTMPGLPKVPAAERISVDESGCAVGLF